MFLILKFIKINISLLKKETHSLIEIVQFKSKNYKCSRKNSNKGFLYKLKEEDNYKYTDIHRASDITITNYWAIDKYEKGLKEAIRI